MSTSLTVRESTEVGSPSLFDMAPAAMVAHASEIATVLADVIKKQRLAVQIQGREYVKVDGWAALGSILGFLPREVDVKELSDGSFEAKVELYSLKSGKVVGQGSAICGVDEKRWSNADRYARRSMAITRATGKAYRLGLSWVMTLAGYEATPAEEMMEIPFAPKPEAPKQEPARAVKRFESPKPAASRKPSVYEGKPEQEQIIQKMLRANNVPEDRWAQIHDGLMGRPSTDLKTVVSEVMSEVRA